MFLFKPLGVVKVEELAIYHNCNLGADLLSLVNSMSNDDSRSLV